MPSRTRRNRTRRPKPRGHATPAQRSAIRCVLAALKDAKPGDAQWGARCAATWLARTMRMRP